MKQKSIFARAMLALGALTLSLQIAQSAAIKVNTQCEIGNCSSPDALTKGQSVGPTQINLSYTFGDGDTYSITGYYQASFTGGTYILFSPIVTYTGSAPSAGMDTLTLDMFQNYSSPGANSWDGSYNENIPFTLTAAPGSTAQGQIQYQTATSGGYQSVGLMGPYGPGTYSITNSKTLSGLGGALLQGDVNFVFMFQAGSQPGSTGASVAPEPSQLVPLGLSLLCGICFYCKWKRGTYGRN